MTAPALRVFPSQAPRVPLEPGGGLTLRAAYEKYLRPRLERRGRAAETYSTYRTALARWEAFGANASGPVSQITGTALEEFADKLLAWHRSRGQCGYDATRKALVCLTAILGELARPHDEEPPLLAAVPHPICPQPTAERPEETRRRISPEEISAAYRVCDVAEWPRRGPAPPRLLWRTLLVLGWTYGPRTWDLAGLRWENVHWAAECPIPRYRQRIASPHGWLSYLPTKTRGKKPQRLHLPLTETASVHLRWLGGPRREGPIFGFPKSNHQFQDTRKAIWRAAGIPAGEEYEFRELRFTASCEWNDLWPQLGEHVTGHAARGVNSRHYDQCLGRLLRFAGELPQPAAFSEEFGTSRPAPTESWTAKLAALNLPAASQETLLKLAEQLAQ